MAIFEIFPSAVPEDWRKGQTLFNFLEWLAKKGYDTEQSVRMADLFYIEDKKLEKLAICRIFIHPN